MARTTRFRGYHGKTDTNGRDGSGGWTHWSKDDCEDFRYFWDPRYIRSKNREIIEEEIAN